MPQEETKGSTTYVSLNDVENAFNKTEDLVDQSISSLFSKEDVKNLLIRTFEDIRDNSEEMDATEVMSEDNVKDALMEVADSVKIHILNDIERVVETWKTEKAPEFMPETKA